jgi:hypothetical protein
MIAIPVRDSKPDQPESLRYVLRSIAHHLPDEEVTLCGHKPDWYQGDHLPTVQDSPEKHGNMGINLLAAVENFPEFTWWSDDTYTLKPVPPTVYARPETVDHLLARVAEIPWKRTLRSQRTILRAWGFDPAVLLCSESHHPMLMNSARARDLLERVAKDFPTHPLGSFKGLYAAGLEVTIQDDPKILHVDKSIKPDATYLSTTAVTFRQGQCARELRAMFPTPCKFER